MSRFFMVHCVYVTYVTRGIRVTRFQQPGTRFLNRVIRQLTSKYVYIG